MIKKVAILLLLIIVCGMKIAKAHDPDKVHQDMTEIAVKSLSDPFASKYLRELRQGSADEDLNGWWINHGYNPYTASGWYGNPFRTALDGIV